MAEEPPRPDPRISRPALLTVSVDGRGDVDATVDRAAASGGRADPNPKQDHGFMFSRSMEDPDGHLWEVMWMDPAAAGGG